jgi:RecT family
VSGQALARPSSTGLDRLRQQFAPRATDEDLGYFAEVCRHLEVDPWAGHICLMGWTDNKTGEVVHRPTLTVAGRRFIAQRTGHLRGIEGPVWCGPRRKDPATGEGFGPLEWREMWDQEDPPYAARCLVFRDDWDRPANGTVKWSEFVQTYQPRGGGDPRPKGTWAQMPSHMLGKVAESLALRRAFAEVASAVAYVGDDDGALITEASAEAFVADVAPPAVTAHPEHPAGADLARREWDLTDAPRELTEDETKLRDRLLALDESDRAYFRAWRRSRAYGWPPPTLEALAEMVEQVDRLEAQATYEADTYDDGDAF